MTAGYKGIVHNHPGYVSAPYNPFRPTTWQDKLRDLELKFSSRLKIGNVSREGGLEDVNLMMRTWYPGNYTVIESYDIARGVFGFKLVFDNHKEEMLWRIKWG